MTRSMRVHFVEYGERQLMGRLLARWSGPFDPPAPAAFGATEKDITTALVYEIEKLRAEGRDDPERYLWSEEFTIHEVKVIVHPLTWVKKQAVVAKNEVPLVVSYLACKLAGGGYRVMLPRFDAWVVLEDLSLARSVLEKAASASLMGETPRWIFELRKVGPEWIRELSPRMSEDARGPWAPVEPFPETARVADDWVQRAKARTLEPVIGELRPRLPQEAQKSVLLVGPPGVGKTARVRQLAWELRRAKSETRVFATSATRILAGMIYLGMWQERCIAIGNELESEGHWLYVDRFTDIAAPQSDGASVLDLFLPHVAAGRLALLAECTAEELESAKRSAPSAIKHFAIERVEPPTDGELVAMSRAHGARRALDIHPAAARRLIDLLATFEQGTAFPGKALRFVDFAGGGEVKRTLCARDVSEEIARKTGLPMSIVSDDEAHGALDFTAALERRVIGQPEACAAAARILTRMKARMTSPERPAGVLLFVGPTGVGKTELAKQIARVVFGNAPGVTEPRMVRLDMSEYMLRGSSARMIDVAPGAISLATRVREQPLGVVLLDEIEKAHPEVFDLLLGVLGEGRLTDARGRHVDFRGTIIIMTSNLGVSTRDPVGFSEADLGRATHTSSVREHFRPELVGRIDRIVPFRSLSKSDVATIVDLELAEVARRTGLARRNLRLSVDPAARAALAERGWDPRRGARPLRRLFEEEVVGPIAARLAEQPDLQGGTIVLHEGGALEVSQP